MKGRWRIGDLIADRYEIKKILAGGMGIIYLCYDHELREVLAVKTFRIRSLGRRHIDLMIKTFLSEANIWIKLGKHRNIVTAKFVEIIEEMPYIFLEYVNGGTLRELIAKRNTIDLAEILEILIKICVGMDYISKAGVVHGDLKPENVMFTQAKQPKITDFGLARALRRNSSTEFYEDQEIHFAGTPHYAAPEQFTHFDFMKADIYAFGVVMYEMLSGELPFKGLSLMTIMEQKIINRSWLQLRKLNPDVPGDLEALIQTCLEINPSNRPKTFEDIIIELQSLYHTYTKKNFLIEFNQEAETAWDLNNRGYSLYNIGYAQEAILYFDSALNIMPDIPEIWLNKSVALKIQGRFRESERCLRRAITLDPNILHDKDR